MITSIHIPAGLSRREYAVALLDIAMRGGCPIPAPGLLLASSTSIDRPRGRPRAPRPSEANLDEQVNPSLLLPDRAKMNGGPRE